MIGNLGADPEVKFTPSGKAVAIFNMAINERWKDAATGDWKESTEWVRIVCWEGLAEIVKEFCKKGSPVFVAGKMRTRSWEKEGGEKAYITEVVSNNLILLGTHKNGVPLPADKQDGGAEAVITNDDIPF
jgi:single-strand DNA-binding protein